MEACVKSAMKTEVEKKKGNQLLCTEKFLCLYGYIMQKTDRINFSEPWVNSV